MFTYESPVFLPCGDSICKKHTIDCQGRIWCHKCELEHLIPMKGEFPPNKELAGIIDSQIAEFEFGKEHKEAKQSCEKLEDLIHKISNFLNDPYNFTYEAIEYLKSVVQLKGEEEILRARENGDRVSKNMHRIIGKLDEYKQDCKNGLNKNENLNLLKNFTVEKERSSRELQKWLAKLNDWKVDCQEYVRIKSESKKAIESLENKFIELKRYLFPKRFDEFRAEIESDFGEFKIDQKFDLQ
jgi:hypothetical protein